MADDQPFATLVAKAGALSGVVGVVLGGSRGKGLGTPHSDWDVYVFVGSEEDPRATRAALGEVVFPIDLCAVLTLEALNDQKAIPDWNRYNFAHLEPVLDRTDGRLQQLCDALELLPPDKARVMASTSLEAYVNSYYRSLKNEHDGRVAAARLDAAESLNYVLEFVFAAEQRVRPYNKFLEWELVLHPLEGDWWPSEGPMATLIDIVSSGSMSSQAALFTPVERRARDLGHGDQLDAWGRLTIERLRRGAVS